MRALVHKSREAISLMVVGAKWKSIHPGKKSFFLAPYFIQRKKKKLKLCVLGVSSTRQLGRRKRCKDNRRFWHIFVAICLTEWNGLRAQNILKRKVSAAKRIKHGYIIFFFLFHFQNFFKKGIKWDAAYWKVDTFRELYSAALMNWYTFFFFFIVYIFRVASQKNIFAEAEEIKKYLFGSFKVYWEKSESRFSPLSSLFCILSSPPQGYFRW